MRKYENTNICYKCGTQIASSDTTTDDLPPKCCVPNDLREKTIRVDSCKICNNGRSSDDEYFRQWLVTGASSTSELAKALYLDKVRASMKSSSKRNTLKNMIQIRELYTSSGIYLGQKHVIIGNENRINSVLDSHGKAIIYHHFRGRNIPLPFGVVPFCIQITDLDNEHIQKMLGISVLVDRIPEVFGYRFGYLTVNDGATFPIFLIFFKRVVFHLNYLLPSNSDSASSAE